MLEWVRSGVVIALLAVGAGSMVTASTMTMSLQEDGDDVVFDFRGTIEYPQSPSFTGAFASVNILGPSNSLIYSLPGSYARHDFGTSGDPFGDGPLLNYSRPNASISTGDVFGFSRFPVSSGGILMLPSGYANGAQLEGRAVFFGTSLASIGAVPGQYSYRFDDNMLNLTVGPDTAVIPLPATGLLLLSTLCGLGLMHRRGRAA